MNIRKIIEDGLKQNGFDGLLNPDMCGCVIGDIAPGDCICNDCKGGYKSVHSITGEFVVSLKNYKFSDEEIEQIIKQCG